MIAPVDATAHAAPVFAWWRAARFGFFIHWGPCSVSGQEMSWSRPAQGAENYDALATRFAAPRFDPDAWVSLALAAGARYLVLVCKHHDGFMLWATDTDPHNVMNTPLGRDVVAEVSAACARAGLTFCVYFSPGDWRDPDCRHPDPERNARFVARMHAQLTELLTRHGRVPLLWFDFDGRTNPSIPAETAALVRRLQPGVLLTNRLDALHPDESHARLGPSGDYVTPEQFVGGYCDHLPWETCMTIGTSWSWRANETVKTLRECLVALLATVGGDGNFLLDVGPHPDGHVEPDQAARLREIGAWLRAHGEAVYGTRGGPWYPTHRYASTRTAENVFVHAFHPETGALALPALPARVLSATLLDGYPVAFSQVDAALTLVLPASAAADTVAVVRLVLDAPPLSLAPIPPASSSGSLAYRRSARVSSSIAPDFLHTAEAALDDDPSTFWSPGRDEALAAAYPGLDFTPIRKDPSHPVWLHDGWLEVDLGDDFTVARAHLAEKPSTPDNHLPVTSWKIEYHYGSAWLPVASGSAIGPALDVAFPRPVSARLFRLSLTAPGRFALSEFQLFPSAPCCATSSI
jgi:alpha-L-fucosidase